MAQKVTVADVEAVPGETVSFSMNLSDGRPDSYSALMFDVQFPAEGFSLTGAYSVSSAWPAATAAIGDVDDTGVATIPFASSSEVVGSDVDDLLTISFKVDESVSLGNYNVNLKNIVFEYGGMEALKDYANDVSFTVRVVNAHVIVLDETSTTIPESATGVDVRVKRTIKANEWSTICLPFDMTEAQVKEAFGEDVQIADFTGADSEFDEADNCVGIKVNFTSVTAIEANHPYVIKVSVPITEFALNGVDIVADEDEAIVEFDNGRTGSRRVVYSGFYGIYQAETVLGEFTLFLSDNKFWYSTGLTKMKAFRAYFDFHDILTEVEKGTASSRIKMTFEDKNTTDIVEFVNNKYVDGKCFDLQGRKIDYMQATSHSSRFNKGVYIVNGKKQVIK